MALETIHDIQKGVRRLLGAPADLSELVPDQGVARPQSDAISEHKKIYREYISDFAQAYEIAEGWWQDCVDACAEEATSRTEAINQAFSKRLAGPASAPEVVWFIRTYWLAFTKANLAVEATERVPPQYMMVQWMIDDGYMSFVQLLTCMPYWPIGLDENGNWC